MVRYVSAIIYGLATIFITALLFAFLYSIYVTTTQKVGFYPQNSILIAAYVISCIGGIVAGLKAKRRFFYIALCLSVLYIIIQTLLFQSTHFSIWTMNNYLHWIYQTVAIVIGTAIGTFITNKTKQ